MNMSISAGERLVLTPHYLSLLATIFGQYNSCSVFRCRQLFPKFWMPSTKYLSANIFWLKDFSFIIEICIQIEFYCRHREHQKLGKPLAPSTQPAVDIFQNRIGAVDELHVVMKRLMLTVLFIITIRYRYTQHNIDGDLLINSLRVARPKYIITELSNVAMPEQKFANNFKNLPESAKI